LEKGMRQDGVGDGVGIVHVRIDTDDADAVANAILAHPFFQ